MARDGWRKLEKEIVRCERCPRLRRHCLETARVRRRMFRDQEYWGKPLPSFGDSGGVILMVGLAPAAHGANRTGRMFTGDRSGDWLFSALHRVGLANRPESISRSDGLKVRGVRITAAARCAPPANRPTREELAACAPFLDREFALMNRLKVVVALGKIAWDTVLARAVRVAPGAVPKPKPKFGHGVVEPLVLVPGRPSLPVIGSYHPSQQNTQTGRLTRPMFDRVVRKARTLGGLT